MSNDPQRQAIYDQIYARPDGSRSIAIYRDPRGHWVARYPADTAEAVRAEIQPAVDRLNHARQS